MNDDTKTKVSWHVLTDSAEIKMTARVPRPLYKFFRAVCAKEGTSPSEIVRNFVFEKVEEGFPEEYKELKEFIDTYYPVAKSPEVRKYWEDKLFGDKK